MDQELVDEWEAISVNGAKRLREDSKTQIPNERVNQNNLFRDSVIPRIKS
jgi:hypothetical protein